MAYTDALERAKQPAPEHAKWHRLFGNDCRIQDCPLKKGATK